MGNSLAGALIVAVIVSASLVASQAAPATQNITEIRLTREPGLDRFPRYTLVFRSDGCAYLHGDRDFPLLGDYVGRTSRFSALAASMESQRFFDMVSTLDAGRPSPSPLPSGLVMAELDASYDSLEVVSGGKTYTAIADLDSEPQTLKDLTLIVDGIGFAVDWRRQQPDCRDWPPPLYD